MLTTNINTYPSKVSGNYVYHWHWC